MNVLMDTSFLIDLMNELADGEAGLATAWLKRQPRVRLWVSAITVAEVLEGAEDVDAANGFLSRFRWQGIHHSHATRVALLQKRSRQRMGENDAWQAAVVLELRGAIVGHDPKAFARLGAAYLDHRAVP